MSYIVVIGLFLIVTLPLSGKFHSWGFSKTMGVLLLAYAALFLVFFGGFNNYWGFLRGMSTIRLFILSLLFMGGLGLLGQQAVAPGRPGLASLGCILSLAAGLTLLLFNYKYTRWMPEPETQIVSGVLGLGLLLVLLGLVLKAWRPGRPLASPEADQAEGESADKSD